MSVLYAFDKAHTVASKTLVKEVDKLRTLISCEMSAVMILYLAVFKADDVAAQGKVTRLHLVANRGCLQGSATLIHLIHIIAKDCGIGYLAAWKKPVGHGCKSTSATNTGKVIHVWGVGILKESFSSESFDGMICHTVAKNYNMFHTRNFRH